MWVAVEEQWAVLEDVYGGVVGEVVGVGEFLEEVGWIVGVDWGIWGGELEVI